MPVKNKPFFVPKDFSPQPDYYFKRYDRVCAAFTHPTKGCTLYLQVDADTWRHADPSDAKGNLLISYETATLPYTLTRHNIPTLKEALSRLKQYLDDEHFGENLPYAPQKAREPAIKYDNTFSL